MQRTERGGRVLSVMCLRIGRCGKRIRSSIETRSFRVRVARLVGLRGCGRSLLRTDSKYWYFVKKYDKHPCVEEIKEDMSGLFGYLPNAERWRTMEIFFLT